MDLDPRKRLTIAKANNPSLRLSVAPKAPQPKLTIAKPKQQQVTIANPQNTQQISIVEPPKQALTFKAPQAPKPQVTQPAAPKKQGFGAVVDSFKKIGTEVGNFFGAVPKVAGDITNAIVKDPLGVAKNVGEAIFLDTPKNILAQGDVEKKGGLNSQIFNKQSVDTLKGFAAEDLKNGLITKAQYSAKISKLDKGLADQQKRIATAEKKYGIKYSPDSAALDVALAGFTPAFKVGKLKDAVKTIAKTNDPSVVKTVLDVPDDVAVYLSKETDPATIEAVVKSFEVDPGLSLNPATSQRLQDAGITRVRQGDTPYGASYNKNEITLRDQSFATDENLYHELGHHLYRNTLTPEERAMFDGKGRAGQAAQGREGYTADDYSSEDFSDFMRMALSGQIDEVPENVRPIIEKYSGVQATQRVPELPAEDIAAIQAAGGKVPVLHLPKLGIHAKISPEQAGYLKDEVKNMPWTPEDRPHLTSGDNVLKNTKEVSIEEFGKASPNAQSALKNADEYIAQQVDDVSRAQTGVSDAPADGAVKTASGEAPQSDFVKQVESSTSSGQKSLTEAPSASVGVVTTKGIKFRDPETKKMIRRSYEDVEAELKELESLPPEQITPKVRERIRSLKDKMFRFRSENAKYAYPDADEKSLKAIQEIMDQLDPASRAFNRAEKARSGERASRITKGEANYEAAGGGEAGVRAKLSALKGKQTASTYDPIEATPETQKTLLDAVENSNLRQYEKLNTQQALRKMWGAIEGKPTAGDIKSIRRYFGDDMANAVQKVVDEMPDGGSFRDTLVDLSGAPRTAMTIGDFSALRQIGIAAARHPIVATKAYARGIYQFFSKKDFSATVKNMKNEVDARGANYAEFMESKMNLALPSIQEDLAEEAMSSANLLSKVPVYGKLVDASNRSFSGTVTALRYNVAKNWIDAQGGIDNVVKNFSSKELEDLGEALNTASGRGGKKGGFVDKNADVLSRTLFSGRLWASRLNSINPYYYARLSGPARKEALTSIASFAAFTGAALTLIEQAFPDVEVGYDPRSADFLKIKVGNTRYDIMGGLQQNIVLAYRIASGEKVDSTTGEVEKIGEGYGSKSVTETIGDFAKGKVNPLLGFAMKLLDDTDDGSFRDISKPWEAAKMALPLGVSETVETAMDQGELSDPANVVKSAVIGSPNFIGIGTNTYGETPSKDKAGKGTLTEKATSDAKAMSKARKDFVEGQSKEDQALMKLGKSKLREYVDTGTITQDKFDSIERLKESAENAGKPADTPESVYTPQAKKFYAKWNSMTEKDQKAWLKKPVSENGKQIAAELNKKRIAGISELKPSNALTKAYAEYEKDIAGHPEYSAVDLRNKAKEFQTKAYKLNYSDDQRDIYNEGGSGDLRTLLENGEVSREDLAEAIKMDNELFASGLSGKLKFSKKFRSDYGYDTPSAPGGGGGGSGGSGGGSGGTKRAGLVDSLVKKNPNGTAPVPTFSSKRRTAGISFKNVNKPTKSNNKKVTINL